MPQQVSAFAQGLIFPVLGGSLCPQKMGVFSTVATVLSASWTRAGPEYILIKDVKWVGKVAGKGMCVCGVHVAVLRPNHQPPSQVISWISAEGPEPQPLGIVLSWPSSVRLLLDTEINLPPLTHYPQLAFSFTSKELKFINCVKVRT